MWENSTSLKTMHTSICTWAHTHTFFFPHAHTIWVLSLSHTHTSSPPSLSPPSVTHTFYPPNLSLSHTHTVFVILTQSLCGEEERVLVRVKGIEDYFKKTCSCLQWINYRDKGNNSLVWHSVCIDLASQLSQA